MKRTKTTTAKQYLMKIEKIDMLIRQRQQEYDSLISDAMCNGSPVLSKDKVQTSMDGDRMSVRLTEAVILGREIERLVTQLVTERHRIIGEIQSLDNPKHIELLYLRYVERKHLTDIADIMKRPSGKPYNYEYIVRLHGYALKEFENKILKCHSKVI